MMVINMMENGKMIKWVDKGILNGLMEMFILVNLKKIWEMEKEL